MVNRFGNGGFLCLYCCVTLCGIKSGDSFIQLYLETSITLSSIPKMSPHPSILKYNPQIKDIYGEGNLLLCFNVIMWVIFVYLIFIVIK